jgi:predicted RNA-binding protein with PIN domain
MPTLIDGHNLIPKVPGMSLQMIDDEDRLIALLIVYCRVRRQVVEVFFDQAPPGYSGKRRAGQVIVHYVRQGKTADQAILDRLRQQGKTAKDWKVVSSDRQVRAEAHALGARLFSSEEFSAELQSARQAAQVQQKENPAPPGPEELEEWLKLFKNKKPRS